jgi:hypothetical protein
VLEKTMNAEVVLNRIAGTRELQDRDGRFVGFGDDEILLMALRKLANVSDWHMNSGVRMNDLTEAAALCVLLAERLGGF